MPAEYQDKPFKDVQTRKRVHEHLSNEKDQISEEDIAKVKTDIVEKSPVSDKSNTPDTKKSEKPDNKKTDESNDPGIETSWNILT